MVSSSSPADLRARLEALVASYGANRLASDPLSLVRPYLDPRDREVAGLVAAALAFGRVPQILRSVRAVLDMLGPRPARAVSAGDAGFDRALGAFRHRWVDGGDVSLLLRGAGRMLREAGSVEAFFAGGLRAAGGDLRAGLSAFARGAVSLAGEEGAARRGFRFLWPDAGRGGAAKRLCLFLRWMVRPDDGLDLGVFSVLSPAELVVPLDTHVHRISRLLGFTARGSADFGTAVEITDALRAICPGDPVRYDFALAQLGISGDCPVRCGRCLLGGLCRRPGGREEGGRAALRAGK